MYALLFLTFLLSSPMLVIWMTYLNDPWHEGFLPKSFDLCVVDSCELPYLVRLVIEPCRALCLWFLAKPPFGGAVVVDPAGVA
jgi:hypothetical protein